MEFPEDFNQLELLDTHGHLIPRGASSLWAGSKDAEEEEEEAAEGDRSEEWYLEKEKALKSQPQALLLWAAEKKRVSSFFVCLFTNVLGFYKSKSLDNCNSINPCRSKCFSTFSIVIVAVFISAAMA